jgi:DNA-binding response OmpR family regulator
VATSEASSAHSKLLILCIDDESQVLDALEEFLTFGYSVLLAQDLETALQFFLNNEIAAVITDYELGQVSGQEVIRSLRALKPSTPVLLLSGRDDLPQSVRSLADACVHKTEMRTLLSELSRVLDSHPTRFFSPDDGAAGVIKDAILRLREIENVLANPERTDSERHALKAAIRELKQIIIQSETALTTRNYDFVRNSRDSG